MRAASISAAVAVVAIVGLTIAGSSRTSARPEGALAPASASVAPPASASASTPTPTADRSSAPQQTSSAPPSVSPPSPTPPVVGPPVTRTYQETSGQIVFDGDWAPAEFPSYSDRAVLWSADRGASATLTFTGTHVSWIGPVGPTRGRAEVFIDGRSVGTVDTWSRHFVPTRVLYSARFPTAVERTIRIVVLGTKAHPFVAVDAFVVVGPGRVESPAPGEGSPSPSSTPTPTTTATGRYGPGIGADSLANTQVGGTDCGCSNMMTSYRFRATTSARLTSVRIYLQDGSGYSGGNGGSLRISVQPDDGSSGHRPAATVLASTTIRPGNPISIGNLPLVTFGSPAALTAGRLYHLVFRNVDASPRANFVSVNALWTQAATNPRQPGLADLDWGQLMNNGSGWRTRSTFTPIADLAYSNGVHAGMGYMEVWVRQPRSISGSSAVREVFTPRADRTVGAVSVRIARSGGSGTLTVRLKTAGGTTLASGGIGAGAVGSGMTWVGASLTNRVTLRAGTTYQLVFSAPSGTTYSTWALERGNHYHFASSTYFADGYGQSTTGSGWSGFDQPDGSSDNTNADLQFELR